MLHIHFLSTDEQAIKSLLNWAEHCPVAFVDLKPRSDLPAYTGHEYIATFDMGGEWCIHHWM